LTVTVDSGMRIETGLAGVPALNSRVRTVDRHLVVSPLPQLDGQPTRQCEVLRSCAPIDLYLIAIGSLNDLVVRQDVRREAIRDLATQAGWGIGTLRWAALRARLSRYVRRDRLTVRGWAQAEVGAERLRMGAAGFEPAASARSRRGGR
jgi:hypothetical protein